MTRDARLNAAEEALRLSEARYRDAITAANVGTWRVDLETNLETRDANLNRILGLPARETTQPVEDYFKRIHPADRARCCAAFHQAIEQTGIYGVEMRLVREDGAIRWVRDRGKVMAGSEGEAGFFTGALVDITEQKQVEESLRLRDRAIGVATNGILITDARQADHPIIHSNHGFERLTGYSADEVVGRNCRFLQGPLTDPQSVDQIRQALREGRECQVTLLNYRKDGRTFWNDLHITPVRDADGTLTHFVGVQNDVTDRVEAERTLRANELFLRKTLDTLFSFVGVCTPEGILIEANRSALDAGNLKAEDVLGQRFEDTYWWSYDENVQRQLRQAIDQAARGHTSRYDVPVRLAEGRLATIDFQIVPMMDEQGRVTHLIPSAIDITDRKRAEEQLAESQERLRLALEAGGMGTWDWNVGTGEVIMDVLEYEVLGASPDKPFVIGDLWNLVHPDDLENFRRIIERVLTEGEEYEHEFRVLGPGGQVRWLAGRGDVVRDPEGKVLRMMGVNWDITERKEAEEQLRDAQERLAVAMAGGGLGVWDLDLVTGKAWRSFRHDQIFGYEEMLPEWTYPMFLQHVVEEDREQVDRTFGETLARKQDCTFQARIRRPDGSIRWIWVQGRPRSDDGGQARRLIGIVQDVTERKQVEAELHKSQERLHQAVEAGELGTWDFNPVTGELVWSDRCKAMFGLPADAEVSYDQFLQGLHPDDRERVDQIVQQALSPDGDGDYDVEYRTVGIFDGVERWIRATGKTIFEGKRAVRFVGTVQDITERMHAERLLRENEERFRLATRAVHGIVYDWDLRTDHIFRSEGLEQILGVKPEEVPPTREWWSEQLHPEDLERLAPKLDDVLQNQAESFDFEYRIRHREGHWVELWDRGYILYARGKPVRVVGSTSDISERKRAEQAREEALQLAESASRAKSEFLAKMSHELRTPLNAVIGMSTMLQTRRFGPLTEKQADYLRDINNAGEHLLQLINDILDLSKIEARKVELSPTPLMVQETIEETLSPLRTIAETKEIHLLQELATEDGEIHHDKGRFKQILYNLVSNALKFTPAGGKVTVRCHWVMQVSPDAVCTSRTETGGLRIEVEDTGVGIVPEHQDLIWESFQTLKVDMPEPVEGTGLGLPLCRQLVELMGGSIWMCSEVGQGSCFSFVLPVRCGG